MSLSRQTTRLTFIGSGNMAAAIIGGLRALNYPAALIRVCGPDTDQLDELNSQYGVGISADNTMFLEDTDLLLLCVKPQIMQAVCTGLAPYLKTKRHLGILSIAAGVNTAQLSTWLDTSLPILRCMPNTPAMVQEGAAGLFAPTTASKTLRDTAETIFGAVGLVAWVEKEDDLHAVTALSGSGPAYCFLFLQALESAGVRMGLSTEVARNLAIQTLRGAGKLAANSTDSPDTLKRKVMSPGGTTEQAIRQFEADQFVTGVDRAVLKAWERSYTLAGEQCPGPVNLPNAHD
ncbi:MAG: pyrroline-5-carboxylate reductase [Hahellaceae bacterium]|nr:pyrroline-5-carboxylate reductase [Hahellaceae bacterium]